MSKKRITMLALILLLFVLAGCLTKDSTSIYEEDHHKLMLGPELTTVTDTTSPAELDSTMKPFSSKESSASQLMNTLDSIKPSKLASIQSPSPTPTPFPLTQYGEKLTISKPYEITPVPTPAPLSAQPELSKKEQKRLNSLQERALTGEIVEIKNGDYFDLDCDGYLERIQLESADDGYYNRDFALTIGNATYPLVMDDPTYKIYLSHMTTGYKDMQILIDDRGPSSDYITILFYYQNGVIYKLGEVGGLATEIKSLGDGMYESRERASTIQTWFHPRRFYISNLSYTGDKEIVTPILVRMPKEMYPVGTRVRLNCDISLLKTKESISEEIRITKGQYATLAASDDEMWLYIQSDNGLAGWLRLETLDCNKVFSGLCNAD